MAKKKKSKVVDTQEDGTEIFGFEKESEPKDESRDMSEANAGIKDHAKFDKFKGEQK